MMMKWIIAAVVCYGATVALLYVGQRSLQYFPERRRTAPQAVGLPEAEEAVLDTADGERVIVWHVPPRAAERIVLWGESLGSAVAIALAADKPVGRLVLEAPFTSAADVGAQHYRFVPVRLFMKDQFRSDLRVGNVTAPVLVHGENDFVVPMTLGKRLYDLIRAPKRFVSVPGAGHNDLGARAVTAAKQFIGEQ
jgi:fermentation-respiration switch protein FrsA (DUF1100 family)